MPVNPGRLRHRVELLLGAVENTPGGPVTTWDVFDRRWAAITQVNASGAGKYLQAGYSDVTHEVLMRAGPSLPLGETLIRWDDRELQPIAPATTVDNRDRFVLIACREVNRGETVGADSSS